MRLHIPYQRAVMPVEIEAKMKIQDVAAMVDILKSHGATPVGDYFETNTFYDTEDRAMLAADEGLRLRVSEDLKTGVARCILTHKGPNAPGQLKSREETELQVASASDAERLLNRLGYQRCLSFQKHRQSWKLDACSVELDEVPHLGHFIEIEGPSEEIVMKTREKLGLASRPLIKASYIAMLSSYIQEHGLAITNINFPHPPLKGMRAS